MLCGYEVTRCLHASDRTRWLHMDCEHWTGTGEDRILALDDGGGSVFPIDAFRPWLPPMMGRRVRVREVTRRARQGDTVDRLPADGRASK